MKKNKSRGESKGAVISFRLTPRDKYAIELIARRDRKSASAVIEQAIAQFIDADEISKRPRTPEVFNDDKGRTFDIELLEQSLLDKLWSPYPWRRLRKLSKFAPELMNADECLIWECIDETNEFWHRFKENGKARRKFLVPIVRRAWPLLEAYADNYDEGQEFDLEELKRIVHEYTNSNSVIDRVEDVEPSDKDDLVADDSND